MRDRTDLRSDAEHQWCRSDGNAVRRQRQLLCAADALGRYRQHAAKLLRMPSIFNNDVALFKNIPMGETRSLQLRWEVYNVFNHTKLQRHRCGFGV